jgi:hypothetical protein
MPTIKRIAAGEGSAEFRAAEPARIFSETFRLPFGNPLPFIRRDALMRRRILRVG